MLGGEGQGLEIARTALEDARIYVAARLSGCLATCLRLLRTELAGPGSRVEDQSLLSLVTTTAVALDCARFQLYRAASLKDQGRDATEEAMRAKLYASEALGEAASALVRVLGPSALLDEHPAARLFRDAKVSAVTAGSDEIMRTSVARALIR
jgi:alkylation response protein AidB-like acyl-CoA dehydrogenase